jgi:hypothetical protein
MKRRVRRHRLPPRRVVIQYDFYGARRGSYWLVMERADVSVCLQHPRFEIDLRVTADLEAFYCVWLGRIPLGQALRERSVRLDGMPGAVRAFPQWFAWSPMAEVVRTAVNA